LQAKPLPAPSAAPATPPASPFAAPQAEPPKKRGRKAAPPAANGPFPQAHQLDDASIPPFLRREQPAAPGIQQNAPAPNPELNAALESVFGLKT
jgi:hypothetical protein